MTRCAVLAAAFVCSFPLARHARRAPSGPPPGLDRDVEQLMPAAR